MVVMLVLTVLMVVVVVVLMLIMVMIMTATGAVLPVVMLVMMLMLFVVMVVTTTGAVRTMIVGVLSCMLCSQTSQFILQGILVLHGLQDGLAVQVVPGGGDDGGVGVVLTEELHGIQQLLLAHAVSTAENDGSSMLHLVVEELTKVLHVDLALCGIGHGDKGVQLDVGVVQALNSTDDIGQLAHARGLDEDTVGLILHQDLLQGLAEVTHQAAADTTGVHLGDLHAGILQEAAVDADLAELVLDQHQLFALVGLLDELLDESGLTGSQEAGKNINFGHTLPPGKNSL